MQPLYLLWKTWQAAALYLNKQVQGGIQAWLRSYPYPPFLEHLSFRIGNQLFFIRVEDVDGKVEGPGSRRGLNAVANGTRGHACIMLMKKKFLGGQWVPEKNGWGLIDASTEEIVDPFTLVTDEKIEMSSWEVHDMAVQIVRDHLAEQGYELMSWQGNPEVDPAIWFVGDSKGPEWVVVRATRYPQKQATRPQNWQSISDQCARMAVPLWRGHAMHVRFTGLE